MAKSKKIKVLYIEDDSDIRLLMRKILSKEPFQFMEASTGLEGLEVALKKQPQLILMDIDLPDIHYKNPHLEEAPSLVALWTLVTPGPPNAYALGAGKPPQHV